MSNGRSLPPRSASAQTRRGAPRPASRPTHPARLRDLGSVLIESAPDAMVVSDREGSIVLVNAQAERLFGYSRAELLGAPVELLLPEAARRRHAAHRARYSADPHVR